MATTGRLSSCKRQPRGPEQVPHPERCLCLCVTHACHSAAGPTLLPAHVTVLSAPSSPAGKTCASRSLLGYFYSLGPTPEMYLLSWRRNAPFSGYSSGGSHSIPPPGVAMDMLPIEETPLLQPTQAQAGSWQSWAGSGPGGEALPGSALCSWVPWGHPVPEPLMSLAFISWRW